MKLPELDPYLLKKHKKMSRAYIVIGEYLEECFKDSEYADVKYFDMDKVELRHRKKLVYAGLKGASFRFKGPSLTTYTKLAILRKLCKYIYDIRPFRESPEEVTTCVATSYEIIRPLGPEVYGSTMYMYPNEEEVVRVLDNNGPVYLFPYF